MHRTFLQSRDRSDLAWLRVNEVGYDEFCRHIGAGVDSLIASRANGKIWVDATPSNTLMVEELMLMFPKAAFLHLVRDGRQVVRSLLASGFAMREARDFRTACEYWSHMTSIALQAEQTDPSRVKRVYHAQMLYDPQALIEATLEFLHLENSDEPARFLRENCINSSFQSPGSIDPRTRVDTTGPWSTDQEAIFEEVTAAVRHQLQQSTAT